MSIITLALVALIILIAFWQKKILLYAIATPVTIVYGLSLATSDSELSRWVAGVAIAMIGTYFLYLIGQIAFEWVKERK